jgi:hypothetical protein
MLALIEVARVPELKDHGGYCTLTREDACIIRLLMLTNGTQFQGNVNQSPPQNIPTFAQILAHRARQTGDRNGQMPK